MLSKEQNEILTRVGKGTPMGRMMRRYWHPIATSAELPEPDSDPIVRKLLGEKFVLFRDTAGQVAVMAEQCLHRGASMALARVEEGGIRCIYHGWKFSVDGTLMDTPNHADPRVCQRLKATVYPVRERSGLIWTYIGPREKEPPFRHFAFDDVPPTHRTIIRVNVAANYLQMWEGGTDTSHVSILHSNVTRPGWLSGEGQGAGEGRLADFVKPAWDDMSPSLEIENTRFGFHYTGIRKNGDGFNARLVPLFLPYGRIIPLPGFWTTVMEVPMDDEHTASYLVDASEKAPMDLQARLRRSGFTAANYSDNTFKAIDVNRYGQDRQAMREKRSWSGLDGLTQEDAAITLSMGPVYDRTAEHLVAADAAIVKLRQRLLESLAAEESGSDPIGLNIADLSGMRALDQDVATRDSVSGLTESHARFRA
jgi:phenylpropionate dioxygenase-like ring-hydroxylating dioxygenase large terminal subunit